MNLFYNQHEIRQQLDQMMTYCRINGIDYFDVRLKEICTETIEVENNELISVYEDQDIGVGVRVIYRGAVGFAASNNCSNLIQILQKAIEVALVSYPLAKDKLPSTITTKRKGHYKTPVLLDPFEIPFEKKSSLLLSSTAIMSSVAGVTKVGGRMHFRKEHQIFADSNGSYITQDLIQSAAGIYACAVGGGDVQMRHYPPIDGGNCSRAGFEYIQSLDLLGHARKTARECVSLLYAPVCPKGYYDIILAPSQMAIQLHESIGHALELDRICGCEMDYGGGSFITKTDILKDRIIASQHVSIIADSTMPGGLGTFGFDDEGEVAQSIMLVEKGRVKNAIASHMDAHLVGRLSNSAGISDGWRNIPITRMTNVNLLPGKWELSDLVAGIDYGFILDGNTSWSIDDTRMKFQFGCEIAYEILKGKITGRIYKNPMYSGITPQFWQSCDGICKQEYWQVFGIEECSKGMPKQNTGVSHGSSPTRFRKIHMGV